MHELVQPPRTASERDTLIGFLDHYRAVVVRKVAGVSGQALRTRLEPSELTLGGIIQHLTEVERHWFRDVFAGEPGLEYRWSRHEPDGEFRIEPDATPEELIDAYRRETSVASEVVASASLDDLSRRPEGRVTLRWILVHMIEETARHAGHADLIREAIDGSVGD